MKRITGYFLLFCCSISFKLSADEFLINNILLWAGSGRTELLLPLTYKTSIANGPVKKITKYSSDHYSGENPLYSIEYNEEKQIVEVNQWDHDNERKTFKYNYINNQIDRLEIFEECDLINTLLYTNNLLHEDTYSQVIKDLNSEENYKQDIAFTPQSISTVYFQNGVKYIENIAVTDNLIVEIQKSIYWSEKYKWMANELYIYNFKYNKQNNITQFTQRKVNIEEQVILEDYNDIESYSETSFYYKNNLCTKVVINKVNDPSDNMIYQLRNHDTFSNWTKMTVVDSRNESWNVERNIEYFE